MDKELQNRVDQFVAALSVKCNADKDVANANNDYKIPYPTFDVEEGTKNIRIVQNNGYGGCSVYCFIAACDYDTKTLGKVTRGSIMKPASWKAPAKHARANVFDDDFGMKACGAYGVVYLK